MLRKVRGGEVIVNCLCCNEEFIKERTNNKVQYCPKCRKIGNHSKTIKERILTPWGIKNGIPIRGQKGFGFNIKINKKIYFGFSKCELDKGILIRELKEIINSLEEDVRILEG